MIVRTLIASTLLVLFSSSCSAETRLKVEPNILKYVEILAKAKEYAYIKYPRIKDEEYYAFLAVENDGYGITFSTIDITKSTALGNTSKKLMVYVLLDKEGMQLKKMHLVK